jgi:hypothetical protein
MPPPTSATASPEAVKHEIAFCLEEYKAVRAEIVANLANSFSTIGITLTATAGVLGLVAGQVGAGRPRWLAIASLLFHLLLWVQLRLGFNVFNLGNYIAEVLSPRLKRAIESLATDGSEFAPPFTWEFIARRPRHSAEYWLMPIEAARYAAPLVVAVATFAGYLLLLDFSRDLWLASMFDGLLISLNVIFVAYSIYAVGRMRTLLRTKPSSLSDG